MKLLMIADDFTGALDAGVQFAKKGFSTKVLVYSKDMSFQAEDADVLVVDAETRHKKPLEAYLTIFRIVKPAAESGVKYLFKKTDSALPGKHWRRIDCYAGCNRKITAELCSSFSSDKSSYGKWSSLY